MHYGCRRHMSKAKFAKRKLLGTSGMRVSWAVVAGLLAVLFAVNYGPLARGCNIKGNIARDTGERIYHVPGQDYYGQTLISALSGERWFCSEQEAIAAGWRRSKV